MFSDYRSSTFGRNDIANRKRTTRRQEGWTLVEILVAVVILTVGLLAVGTMQISAIRGNFMGGNTSIALTLASERMEDLLNRNYNDPFLNDSNTANNGDLSSIVNIDFEENVTDSGTVGAGGFYRRIWNIADTATPWPTMKEITVTVTWENNRHRVTLSSMRRP
jgi:prepilin-type N-terminal cleavage/methylation domain-containing protein